jgi:hypothetical protein
MPLYVFQSEDGRFDDLFYTMAEVPSVGTEIEIDGIKWRRVFTKPNAAISTQTDPYSAKDFNKSLDGKKVTVGDLWDASKEASIKRGGVSGEDPIKTKYYDQYAKDHKGTRHTIETKEKSGKTQDMIKQSIKKALGT